MLSKVAEPLPLDEFSPVFLKDLDAVSLLSRYDTKTYFHLSRLPSILKALQAHYHILEVLDQRQSHYKSLYYDTADYELYTRHHNGHLNRYKVRYRKYVDSDVTFFEIKFKNNKGKTIKTRIPCPDITPDLSPEAVALLSTHTPLDVNELQPSIWIDFDRITLVSKNFDERATIDFNLCYRSNGKTHEFPNLAIVEIKQDRLRRRSPFMRILRQHHIFPQKISKYCTGIITCLDGKIKHNRFKKNLRRIHKVIDQ